MNAINERIARIEDALALVLPDSVDQAWLARVAGQECPEAKPILSWNPVGSFYAGGGSDGVLW